MPAQLSGLLGRLQAQVKQFDVAQRTIALIGVAVLVLGAAALGTWVSKPTMSPLFANLSSKDASAIVDHLTSAGVAYELTDGGSTILVPNNQLYTQRLAVAAAGLPTNSDGGGYSLLDDMGMTSSEFQQQVTYQRALEGELARTVGAIVGVEEASVRLALPEDSVFVSERADPTASVFVRTRTGAQLSSESVQAIVHLVSAGIEGMSPTDVAVIDAEGKVLSAVGGTPGAGLASGQTGEYEARVAAGVQSMLDKLVGVGNAVVSVSAELDYDQLARTSERYEVDPENPAPALSSATTTEEYTGAGNAVGGVLGPDNIAVPGGEGGGEYRKESETLNNAVNRTVEQLTTAPGGVRRQSVSVVVSEQAGAALNMAQLEQAVVAAAGADLERGDVVSVSRMAFDTSNAAAAEQALTAAAAEAKAQQEADLIRTGVIAGVALLVVILLMVSMARRSRQARRTAIDLGALEVEAAQAAAAAAALEMPEPVQALPPAPAVDPVAAKREDVMALAADQPAEVADALRGWLAGSRR